MQSSIAKKFEKEKKSTLAAAESYLNPSTTLHNISQDPVDKIREKAFEQVPQPAPRPFEETIQLFDDYITKAIDNLEHARDKRAGITRESVNGTTIRDARQALENQDVKRLGPEAFEMQYLNAMRAFIDVLRNDLTIPANLRRNCIEAVHKRVQEFAKDEPFKKAYDNNATQQELATLAEAAIGDSINAIGRLSGKGMDDKDYFFKRVNVAKDFQNFKHEQHNIVSITSLGDDGTAVVEAEIALRGITEQQKAEYQAIARMGEIRKAFEAAVSEYRQIVEVAGGDKIKVSESIIKAYQNPNSALQGFNDVALLDDLMSRDKPLTKDEDLKVLQGFVDAYTAAHQKPPLLVAEPKNPQGEDWRQHDRLPQWYMVMQTWEKKLVENVAPKIATGEYVIPTQLRQIAGMRNAFEKVTAVARQNPAEDEQAFKVVASVKHAGTIAGFSRVSGKEGKKISQAMTDGNAKQFQEWAKDEHGKQRNVHLNTLNSPNNPFDNKDKTLVKRGARAMENLGDGIAKVTNTAFNALRRFTGANNYKDAKKIISEFANKVDKMLDNVGGIGGIGSSNAVYHTLRGEKANIFGVKVDTNVAASFKKDPPSYPWIPIVSGIRPAPTPADKALRAVLVIALELREAINDAEKVSWKNLTDKENKNLDVSEKIARYHDAIKQYNKAVQEHPTSGLQALPETVLLITCASGKDRTGLAMHNISAQGVARETGKNITEVDKAMLKGSTAVHNAGSPGAGGATIGCYGTKKETKPGIPESRKEELPAIMEPSARNNTISHKGYKEAKAEASAIEEKWQKAKETRQEQKSEVKIAPRAPEKNPEPRVPELRSKKGIVDISKPFNAVNALEAMITRLHHGGATPVGNSTDEPHARGNEWQKREEDKKNEQRKVHNPSGLGSVN